MPGFEPKAGWAPKQALGLLTESSPSSPWAPGGQAHVNPGWGALEMQGSLLQEERPSVRWRVSSVACGSGSHIPQIFGFPDLAWQPGPHCSATWQEPRDTQLLEVPCVQNPYLLFMSHPFALIFLQLDPQ